MKTAFRESFARDLKNIKDRNLLKRISRVIEEVESARSPSEIPNLKKLTGPGDFFRIRQGDWRIGLIVRADVVEFVRCLHRRDMYRYFP